HYTAQDGETYQLNFNDTPGHVDFPYELSRSLARCEGALLLVDAAQGPEAQPLANRYTAIEMGIEGGPVLNQIELPHAEPLRVAEQIEDNVGIEAIDAAQCAEKAAIGIGEVLARIAMQNPARQSDGEAPLQVVIIRAWFENHQG